ncbi:hypothetical protein [Aquibacillus rhizosphaerae]|uniref:Uncharacterized protein n=1 Tax=Aquibacillus rhizosphaerae TaxID=3051431 RepID=A0ABT7L314_9BACI|nr:hypothetical protein [Aquibacillus sp. LR5S19]MDL4840255.1 hypothetical protein [Aquibacillus sp. LR5S19]
MDKKERKPSEEYFDHYVSKDNKKETADADELTRFYSKNGTIPIDVSKFDK